MRAEGTRFVFFVKTVYNEIEDHVFGLVENDYLVTPDSIWFGEEEILQTFGDGWDWDRILKKLIEESPDSMGDPSLCTLLFLQDFQFQHPDVSDLDDSDVSNEVFTVKFGFETYELLRRLDEFRKDFRKNEEIFVPWFSDEAESLDGLEASQDELDSLGDDPETLAELETNEEQSPNFSADKADGTEFAPNTDEDGLCRV